MTTPASLFDLYFQYVEDTEAPLPFHRWSLIAGIGAILGRDFYFPFGDSRIFPNCYIMLVGNPGTRKSSAIKGIKKLIARSGYQHFAAEKTTKEKFLLDLEGLPEEAGNFPSQYGAKNGSRTRGGTGRDLGISPQDVLAALDLSDGETINDRTPRESFVCADEFNEFTGSGNLDFFSLLGALWDWDDEHSTYRYRLKNSKSLSIYQPTISILGGNTHTGIQTGFPPETVGQGFMSRLLLIHGEPSGKKITFPKKPPEELGNRICELLGKIKETVKGQAEMSAQAGRALDTIYRSWKDLDDYRFKNYSTRRFTHLIKLTLICAASRVSIKIEEQDVVLANTLLSFIEHSMPKALGEFGKSRNSEAAQAIMARLYEATAPLKFEELWKVVSRDLDKRDQLADILSGLQSAGKIQATPGAGFLPKIKPANRSAVYVDFKLLKESL